MQILFIILTALIAVYIIINLIANRQNHSEKLQHLLPKFHYIIFASVLAVFGYHFLGLLTNNFNYAYVYEYSSINQPILYKIAANCSGQGGVFIFWLLAVCTVGLFLHKTIKNQEDKYIIAAIFNFLPLILSIALIAINPFELTLNKFEQLTSVPSDGLGLKPILQSPYNLLHPPFIFISFSVLFVPFVLALASLLKQKYSEWQKLAARYNAIGLFFLASALVLGSAWAYNSFGWGGFWGWDPIENAALIPMILAVILVHCFVIYDKTKGLIKTTYFFALTTFPFVIICTSLVRSNKIASSSMHTYAQSTQTLSYILLGFLVLSILVSLIFIFKKLKLFIKNSDNSKFDILSREMMMSFGCVILFVIAFVVFVGTCFPFFAPMLNKEDIAITSSFYLGWITPLAIIYFVLIAFSTFLNLGKNDFAKVSNRMIISLALALTAMVFSFYHDVIRIEYLLLTFACSFTIFSNIEFFIRNIKHIKTYAACFSHIGIAIFVLAAMLYGNFEKTQIINLKPHETVKIFNKYDAEFIGFFNKEGNNSVSKIAKIKILRDGKENLFYPKFFYQNNGKPEMPMLVPSIKQTGIDNIYISPLFYSINTQTPYNIFTKGESRLTKVDNNIAIEVLNIGEKDALVCLQDAAGLRDTLSLDLHLADKKEYLWNNMFNSEYQFALAECFKNEQKLILIYKKANENLPKAIEEVKIEFSEKPFMAFVWIGMLIFTMSLLFQILIPKLKQNTNN